MISEKMQKLMNEQINKELYSAYLYLSMVAYLEDKNLKGFANYFKVQVQEERDHKTNFFLQWVVNEQTEEEANMNDNIKKLELIENDVRGILLLDAELMTRVYTPAVNPALGANM